jgi:MFS family permease
MGERQWPVVLVLGTTQTLAWASSYYLPAILADPIARDAGVPSSWIFAVFSAALLISALLGPRVGRTIDALGGRGVLALSNVVFAAGLALLGIATSFEMMLPAWVLIGVAMGLGLYDAAFATLGRLYGEKARPAITGITLIAGFASTVGWPLTAWGESVLGWRGTCLGWASLHIVMGLPLNLWLLPKVPAAVAAAATALPKPHIPLDRTMWLLGFAFAAAAMVATAMAAHLPRLLEAAGATTVQAVAAGALIGPAQVGARLMEAGLLARFHPLASARLSAVTHPAGALVLAVFGGGLASLFAVLHGIGTGIMTIARGTVPLALFGRDNYGYRLGLLGAPARFLQALAPLVFGILIDRLGTATLAITSALSIAGLLALYMLPARSSRE